MSAHFPMINPSKSNYRSKLPAGEFRASLKSILRDSGTRPSAPSRNVLPPWLPLQNFKSKYHSISNLGNGSFGTVELAKYHLDKENLLKVSLEKRNTLLDPLEDSLLNLSGLVAIKTMKKKLTNLADYSKVKEVQFILSISSHPCLVQVYEMFIDDVNYQLHISMESLNQNLYQLMKARRNVRFSPVTLKSILSQILCAIGHIHKHDYFHRDVKPENILVVPTAQYYGSLAAIPPHRKNDNFVVKLADYGLARHIANTKVYTAYVSTRWYRSPEILLRQKRYSRPIDIWAFGCVAAEVANFSPLFPGSNELDQLWRILRALGSPVLSQSYDPEIRELCALGGQWDEAEDLASSVGFAFPLELGTTIENIFPNPMHSELAEVVQTCLTWDPTTRSTYEEVAAMSYFNNTIVILNQGEPSRPGNELFKEYEKFPSAISPSTLNRNRQLGIPLKPLQTLHEGSSAYDDLDDGYEVDFMKENRGPHPYFETDLSHKLHDEGINAFFETDDVDSEKEEECSNEDVGSENSLKLEYSFHTQAAEETNSNSNSNTHSQSNSNTNQAENDYSWGPLKKNLNGFPTKEDLDELDESFERIQDLSFESGQEINV